jgi:hypothetical protein
MKNAHPLIVTTFSLLFATSCVAATGQSASQFLRTLYAHYASGQSDFNPTGRLAPTLFTPALLSLIRHDQTREAGDVGRLDHDPVCACQDFDGFRPQSITITTETSAATHAIVRFHNAGHETTVGYSLVRQHGQWKIADIANPAMPSLRHFLSPTHSPN